MATFFFFLALLHPYHRCEAELWNTSLHVASRCFICLPETDSRPVRPQAGAQPAPHRPASVGGPPEALAAATFCALLAP